MYTIEFTEVAEKQFFKLETAVQDRILATLERIRIRPYAHVKKLVGNPYYSIRAGQYRAILDIRDEKLLVFVVKVGDRKNIYKQ